jgi:phosphoglycolate phosphatase-like HAD superfamily hydrolase
MPTCSDDRNNALRRCGGSRLSCVREKLDAATSIVFNVGDTPFDAKAGLRFGSRPVGTEGGGFAREQLLEAG